MNFRSVAQLSDQLMAWSRRLPADYDVVVGIPRSGLLVATLFALYRNLPLTDVAGLLNNRCFGGGESKRTAGKEVTNPLPTKPCRVLVLDDSVWSGKQLALVKAQIAEANLPHQVEYGAVYVLPGSEHRVDHFCEVLPAPRVFEWNVLHVGNTTCSCFDFDGVLCPDPTGDENDDGEKYRRFLIEAPQLLRPTSELGWIVTSRLERYRPETENWLKEKGIRYRQLVMMDYPDGATRRSFGTHSAFKADFYRRCEARLFVESSIKQSFEIATMSGKEVLCIDTMQMIRPGSQPLQRPMIYTDLSPRMRKLLTVGRRVRSVGKHPLAALRKLLGSRSDSKHG